MSKPETIAQLLHRENRIRELLEAEPQKRERDLLTAELDYVRAQMKYHEGEK